MNKYTPAPWGLFDGKSSSLNGRQIVLAVKHNHGFEAVNVETGERSPDFGLNGETVAVVYEDTEKFQDWTPNARLIASAPELLEALQDVTASLMHYMIEKEGAEKVSWILENSPASGLRRARAIIQKATGGKS